MLTLEITKLRESDVHDVLQYATYDEAVAAGFHGRYEFIARGLGQDDLLRSRRNFGLIKAFNEEERYRFTDIAICSMVNLRSESMPRRLALRGGKEMETLKCWKALHLNCLHQIEIHEEHRGFFGVPDSLDGPQTLDSGYQCSYLSNYPGYKHAAGKKNGRAKLPVVVCMLLKTKMMKLLGFQILILKLRRGLKKTMMISIQTC